ncbi:MAG: metallophosphoesterase, partial [Candidatus Eremiobacterota bacterium]
GAGGAGLYNPDQSGQPSTWQPFTRVFQAREHSYTVCEADSTRLSVRQVAAASGKELDRFEITR